MFPRLMLPISREWLFLRSNFFTGLSFYIYLTYQIIESRLINYFFFIIFDRSRILFVQLRELATGRYLWLQVLHEHEEYENADSFCLGCFENTPDFEVSKVGSFSFYGCIVWIKFVEFRLNTWILLINKVVGCIAKDLRFWSLFPCIFFNKRNLTFKYDETLDTRVAIIVLKSIPWGGWKSLSGPWGVASCTFESKAVIVRVQRCRPWMLYTS